MALRNTGLRRTLQAVGNGHVVWALWHSVLFQKLEQPVLRPEAAIDTVFATARVILIIIVDQNGNALFSRRVAALGSLFKKSAVITGIGQALKDATIEYIMSTLMSFHGGNQYIRNLLLHFELQFRAVIEGTYGGFGWDQDSMVSMLEACHSQALSSDLHADSYFAP